MFRLLRHLPLGCLIGALVSCAGVKKAGEYASSSFGKVSEGVGSAAENVGSFARNTTSALMPNRVPIAEVREDELKDYELGHDKAVAYQRQRRQGFWIFGGSVDFEEPALPEIGEEPEESLLLPPKAD